MAATVLPVSSVVVYVYVVAGALPVGPGLPTGPAPAVVPPKGTVLVVKVLLQEVIGRCMM